MISDFNESKKFNTGMDPLSLKYINDDALFKNFHRKLLEKCNNNKI